MSLIYFWGKSSLALMQMLYPFDRGGASSAIMRVRGSGAARDATIGFRTLFAVHVGVSHRVRGGASPLVALGQSAHDLTELITH